jgi:hypothetical protein
MAHTPFLQFLHARAVCDVTHKADKETPAMTGVLGQRNLHRELSTALVHALQWRTPPGNVSLPGGEVSLQRGQVVLPMTLRHQVGKVLAHHLS